MCRLCNNPFSSCRDLGEWVLRIYTVGHSTRTIEQLVQILAPYNVDTLVDVRSLPRSFRNPQFNSEVLASELAEHKIRYVWLQKLGGRRKGLGKQSKNTCWKNKAFRNYADYMETPSFEEGVTELTELASGRTVAIMCAEAVYWKCHRSMVSDSLKSKGIAVTHLLKEGRAREHEYNQCAKIRDGKLSYH